ncbi:S-layer homology domain-containing protein [Paenibacillus sp. 32352]|uniref:S-layer homology domain-containing protein n=1 Tax=Paenibacillus sp. 32352 TaxID=1969111 RepID=UPI0015C4CA5F|nr:S-layer homology domain-containing protein [Paenibacillus sp. 32352]
MKRKLAVATLFSTIIISTQSAEFLLEPRVVYGESSTVFSDIGQHWAGETILWAVDKGITKGYEDGTFKPNKLVSEAEFITLLIRAYKPDIKSGAGGNWAGPYYDFSKKMNYPVSNNVASEFMGDPAITRRAVAEIIAASQGVNYDSDNAIRYLLTTGIASGSDPNNKTIVSFKPDEPLTRAESVQLIRNLSEKGKKELLAKPEKPSDTSLLASIPYGENKSTEGQTLSPNLSSIPDLYVNGNPIDAKQGEPMIRGGILYVPLEPVVVGMGDSFTWEKKPYAANVKTDSGDTITITVANSIAFVDGKQVPISTLNLENTKVSLQASPVIMNNKMFVPYDFLENVLGYPVEAKKDGSKDVVYVGKGTIATPIPTPTPSNPSGSVKEDPRYPFPDGWTPPQITSTWTSDKQKNMEILENELGFKNLGAGARYSPYGKGPGTTAILVSADDSEQYDTMITISVWTGSKYTPLDYKIPYIAKELFGFYFPQKSGEFWEIVDNLFNDKVLDQYIGKKVVIEDREVKFMDVNDQLVIIVGKPGIRYDDNWKNSSAVLPAIKEDPRYPFPDGWTPPQITSTWTSDKQKNMEILENELGFKNLGAGASYRTKGTIATSAIGVSADKSDLETDITIGFWKGTKSNPESNKVPYVTRELLKFYFPTSYETLWQICDDAFNGVKGVGKYFDKVMTYDNRQVKMIAVNQQLVITVGKPGTKYDSNWNKQ